MVAKECPTPASFKAMIPSILFLTLLFYMSFIGRFIFAPLMPSIVKDLDLSSGQAGSIFMIGSLGVFVGSVLSGFVSSRITHRRTMIFSMFAISVALFASALIDSLRFMWGVFLIVSMAAGLNLPSNMAVITAIVRREDWGKALAVQQMGPPLSLITGPLFCVILLPYFSWRIPLSFLAGITLIVAISLMKFGKFGDFPGDAPNMSHMKSIVTLRSFWIIVILFALGIGGQVGVYAMMPLYLVSEHGMNTGTTNTLIGLSQVSALFMTFFSGWVTDRIGEKRAIAVFLMISGLITMLLGMASGPALKLIIFLQPASIVCYFPAGFAALARIVQPHMRSLVTAWATPVAFFVGGGFFPVVLGFMGQNYSFAMGFILAGVVIVIGSTLVIFLNLLEKIDEGC